MKRKIIIAETSPEHLMFVRKCQAILNLGFGLVVNKFSKLEHIESRIPETVFRMLARQYGLSVFHENLNLSIIWHEYVYNCTTLSTSAHRNRNFLTSIKFS